MKSSNIGGQALIEGVMMKNADTYAVAVRKPNNEIEIKTEDYKSIVKSQTIRKIPILRGMINFVDSMILGMSTLTYSASFFEEEEETKATDKQEEEKKGFGEKLLMTLTVAFSVVMAIGIFMVLPYFISGFFKKIITSQPVLLIVEGLIRICIFLIYVSLISLMEDIKRVFMYHGAEHKCINCIEHGLPLDVEHVRDSSRQHKRCGTSFMLIVIVMVMVVNIIVFSFITIDTIWMKLLVRIILIPIIAGFSYEFLRVAGRSESKLVDLLSKPGMQLQRLTTREPDDSMIEVAIASVESVFCWKTYQNENFGTSYEIDDEEKDEA